MWVGLWFRPALCWQELLKHHCNQKEHPVFSKCFSGTRPASSSEHEKYLFVWVVCWHIGSILKESARIKLPQV